MDNRSEIQGVQDDAVQAATRKSALTLGHDHLFGHKLSPFARQAINNTARPLGASSSKGKHSARARSAAVLAPGLAAGDWYPAATEIPGVPDHRDRQMLGELPVAQTDEIRSVVAGIVADEHLGDPAPESTGIPVQGLGQGR